MGVRLLSKINIFTGCRVHQGHERKNVCRAVFILLALLQFPLPLASQHLCIKVFLVAPCLGLHIVPDCKLVVTALCEQHLQTLRLVSLCLLDRLLYSLLDFLVNNGLNSLSREETLSSTSIVM